MASYAEYEAALKAAEAAGDTDAVSLLQEALSLPLYSTSNDGSDLGMYDLPSPDYHLAQQSLLQNGGYPLYNNSDHYDANANMDRYTLANNPTAIQDIVTNMQPASNNQGGEAGSPILPPASSYNFNSFSGPGDAVTYRKRTPYRPPGGDAGFGPYIDDRSGEQPQTGGEGPVPGDPNTNAGLGIPMREYFPYQTWVDRNPLQLAADDLALANASEIMPALADKSQQSWQDLLSAYDVVNNPYVMGQLDANRNQVTKALQEDWMPQVHANAIGTGNYGGSSHAKMQERIMDKASQNLANTNAQTMLGAYGQGLNAASAAQQRAPQQVGLQQLPLDVIGAVGGRQQQDQYMPLQDAMSRWEFGQNQPMEYMTQMGNLLNTLSGNFQSQSQPSPTSSPWAGAMGGLAAGAGLYNQFFPQGNTNPSQMNFTGYSNGIQPEMSSMTTPLSGFNSPYGGF